MWRLTYPIRVFLILSFSLVVFSGILRAEEPSIRFFETRYEFGSVKKGERIIHDFEFTNEGSGILRIEKLIPA